MSRAATVQKWPRVATPCRPVGLATTALAPRVRMPRVTRTRASLRAGVGALAIGGLATAGHAVTGVSSLALLVGLSLLAAAKAVVRPRR